LRPGAQVALDGSAAALRVPTFQVGLVLGESQSEDRVVMNRAWTKSEIALLGTKPDHELGRLLGRPGKAVWRKRRSLGIDSVPPIYRRWTAEEDEALLSMSVDKAAKLLRRTAMAVVLRRTKVRKRLGLSGPPLLTLQEAKRRIAVPRYSSAQEHDVVKFIAGPYEPPLVPIGRWLKCKVRGLLRVGGYTNALIPWPTAEGNARQLILCGDLVRALRTESGRAVCFHFGISHSTMSFYRKRLEVERYNAGSLRLQRRNVELARSPKARAKMSRQREGRKDLMRPADRRRLWRIQKRPKPLAWRRKMEVFWRRRYALIGKPPNWSEEELKLIGTRPDREVARTLGRSLLAVKAKKFQLLKARPGRG